MQRRQVYYRSHSRRRWRLDRGLLARLVIRIFLLCMSPHLWDFLNKEFRQGYEERTMDVGGNGLY